MKKDKEWDGGRRKQVFELYKTMLALYPPDQSVDLRILTGAAEKVWDVFNNCYGRRREVELEVEAEREALRKERIKRQMGEMVDVAVETLKQDQNKDVPKTDNVSEPPPLKDENPLPF